MQRARVQRTFGTRRRAAAPYRSHRRDRAATGVRRRGPQTRGEIDRAIAGSPLSAITEATRYWLVLDDERAGLEKQKLRVRDLLQDKLLEAVLSDRLKVLGDALHRRAAEISRMPASQVADVSCKCYLRQRILQLWPQDSALGDTLYRAIRRDLTHLGVRVEAKAA